MVTSKDEVVGKNIKKVLLLSLILMFVTSFGNIGTVSAMTAADTDNDGYKDGLESSMGTDLNLIDTDNDGLIDSYDPNPISIDADGDELTDIQEFTYGTSSYSKDTDGDGESDKVEVDKKTNPTYGEVGTIAEVAVTGEDAVDAGTTSDYKADVTGTGNYNHSVTWIVEGSESETGETTIDKNGLLTVADDETASTLMIMATSVQDTSKVGHKEVTVNPAVSGVTEVTVTGPGVVEIGSTTDYEAKVTGTGDYDDSVTWTIEGSESATGETTIDQNGELTVADDEAASTLMIMATSVQDTSKVGHKEVTVNPTISGVTGVTVTGPDVVDVGSTSDYEAVVTGDENIDDSVTWTVEGSQSATNGTTIDQNGLLTVADDETSSTLMIKATSVQDTSKVGHKEVTVNSTITGVTVTGPEFVGKGSTGDYEVEVTGTGDYDESVEWTVAGNNDTETKIDSEGVLTVATTETEAVLTVKATSNQDANVHDEMEVFTTTEPVVTNVVLEDEDEDGIFVTNEAVIATITFANVIDETITDVELDGVEGEQVVEDSYSYSDDRATVDVAFNIPGDGSVKMGTDQTVANITEIVQNGANVDVADENIFADIAGYGIYNEQQLQFIDLHPEKGTADAVFCVMNDINASSIADFDPIDDFYATFDGQEYTISGYYSTTNGLFDETNYGAVIKNVNISGTVENSDSSIKYFGLLIGFSKNTTIENCSASGDVTSPNEGVGCLVGGTENSTVENCYATGNVTGKTKVGGLVGHSLNSTISNSYATGKVDGVGFNIGGFVGFNSSGPIENCYATGNVTGDSDYVGGFVGNTYNASISNCYATGAVTSSGLKTGGFAGINHSNSAISTEINNCYATGNVNGYKTVGGFVGSNDDATINNCYSTGDVVGTSAVKGFAGNSVNDGTFNNSYAYEYQLVQGELVKEDASLAGTGDTNYVATYDNLCDSNWHMNTLQMGSQFIYQDDFYPQLKNSVTTEEIPGQVDTPIKQPSRSEEPISDKITQPIEVETDTIDEATQNTDVIDSVTLPPVEDGADTLEEETLPIEEGTLPIEEGTDTIEEGTDTNGESTGTNGEGTGTNGEGTDANGECSGTNGESTDTNEEGTDTNDEVTPSSDDETQLIK